MTPPGPTPRRPALWNRSDCLAMTVLLGVWGVCLTCRAVTHTAAMGRRPRTDPARVKSVREMIDPNTAPPASLRRLPMIGPAKADAIVAYREKHRGKDGLAFTSAEDLENVRGIGPAIVKRVEKYMAFPDQ